jgi:hypothetical protein
VAYILRRMLRGIARQVETLLGLACVFGISLLVIVMSILMAIGHQSANSSAGVFGWEFGGALLLVAVDAVFLCVLSDNLNQGWTPFALEFALRHRHMPRILRPLVCLWSLAHFLLGAVLAFSIEAALAGMQSVRGSVIYIAAFFVIGFTLANAFNIYAMFALAAAGAGEKQIRFAWNWRAALDVMIAVAAEVFAMKHNLSDY